MKLEPQILHGAGADWGGFVALAGVIAVAASIAAVAEARRGPSTAAGGLCGLVLLSITILAVLVGSVSAHAAEVCVASQYGVGDGYHGRRTASGRIFDTYANNPYTIARPSRADLGRRFRITNLKTGVSIEALSTDLGPFIAGRCVDLGRAGAEALGIGGLGFVRVEPAD